MDHKATEVLRAEIIEGYKLVKQDGVYAHYKTPSSRYKVEKLVIIEATEEIAVLYSPLNDSEISFVRPLSNWLEEVDGVERFTLVDPPVLL